MTEIDYGEWVTHHATLFWMKTEEDKRLFAAWRQSLIHYDLGELIEASTHISADPSKSKLFRTSHLALLRSRVQSRRFERTRAENEQHERERWNNACTLCSGCGLVFVPHPQTIVDGIWVHPFYTFTVACECPRGVAKFNAINEQLTVRGKTIRLQDLKAYEFSQPHWREIMAERDATRRSERGAYWYALKADQAAPIRPEEVARRVAGRLGQRTAAAIADESEV